MGPNTVLSESFERDFWPKRFDRNVSFFWTTFVFLGSAGTWDLILWLLHLLRLLELVGGHPEFSGALYWGLPRFWGRGPVLGFPKPCFGCLCVGWGLGALWLLGIFWASWSLLGPSGAPVALFWSWDLPGRCFGVWGPFGVFGSCFGASRALFRSCFGACRGRLFLAFA